MPRKPRQLLTHLDAVETKKQHKSPCSDCPWARTALPGWLGSMSAEEWIAGAHGEMKADCHTTNQQCAGLAIFRSNICKSVRDPDYLHLPSDKVKVFANPQEFLSHHKDRKIAKKASDNHVFKEAVIGYGFEEVEQVADGLFCEGCLTVHKRPTKMYRTGSAPKKNWCRHAVIVNWNPEEQ